MRIEHWVYTLHLRLRSLLLRNRVEQELDEELRDHLENQIAANVARGMTMEDARYAALRAMGGVEQRKEECRDARGVSLIESMMQDLRYGWRTLLKSPGFAAAALFTLALGIGANTAIFSVGYGILLRPLPFRDVSRLVLLNETTPQVGDVSVSYPNFQDWRMQSRTFTEMAAVSGVKFNMAGSSQPENISGLAVSPNFLPMVGVRPVMGRGFTADEEKAGAAPVVLLSHALWQSHFGADRGAIGQTIRLDSQTVTIIGVLPP